MAAYLTPDAIAEIPDVVDELDELDPAIDPWTLDELDASADLGSLRFAGAFASGYGD